jgi:hypothetical protein
MSSLVAFSPNVETSFGTTGPGFACVASWNACAAADGLLSCFLVELVGCCVMPGTTRGILVSLCWLFRGNMFMCGCVFCEVDLCVRALGLEIGFFDAG